MLVASVMCPYQDLELLGLILLAQGALKSSLQWSPIF